MCHRPKCRLVTYRKWNYTVFFSEQSMWGWRACIFLRGVFQLSNVDKGTGIVPVFSTLRHSLCLPPKKTTKKCKSRNLFGFLRSPNMPEKYIFALVFILSKIHKNMTCSQRKKNKQKILNQIFKNLTYMGFFRGRFRKYIQSNNFWGPITIATKKS